MSGFRPLQALYIAGALASILGFVWTVYVIGPPPWNGSGGGAPHTTASSFGATFELSGTDVSGDVQKALIMLGELEGEPGNSRDPVVREAVRTAEADRGLPTDGRPDEALLRKLKAELDETAAAEKAIAGETAQEETKGPGWTLDDGIKATQIMTAISGILLTWLGVLRPSRRKSEALG